MYVVTCYVGAKYVVKTVNYVEFNSFDNLITYITCCANYSMNNLLGMVLYEYKMPERYFGNITNDISKP